MKKRSYYGLIVFFVVITTVLQLTIFISIFYQYRNQLSNRYYESAVSEDNLINKEYELKQALLLSSNQDKYLTLCELYIYKNKPSDLNNCQKKIKNNEINAELTKFQNFQKSPSTFSESNISTKTNYGKLLYVIINDNFSDPGDSLYGQEITKINKQNLGYLNSRWQIANIFLPNHPKISRYILEKLKISYGNFKPLQKIYIQTFAEENDYGGAFRESLNLVKIDPSDLEAYQLSLSYAKKIGNQKVISDLNKQIVEIHKIK